jgi:hypothetical protein
MTNEDIIRMAREAGLWPAVTDSFLKELQEFAALVAAAERERILDMCKEGLWDGEGIRFHLEKREHS